MNTEELNLFDGVNETINNQEIQKPTDEITQFNLESVSQATLISYLLS